MDDTSTTRTRHDEDVSARDLPDLMPPHPKGAFHLANADAWRDLHTLIQRARRLDGGGAAILSGSGSKPILAVWISVMDSTSGTVLGMRTFELSQPGDKRATVYLSGLADRLAREKNAEQLSLSIPPVRASANWASNLPPLQGWTTTGRMDVAAVREVAQTGAKELSDAVPVDAGPPIVEALRDRIWFTPMAEGIPSGAAFALDVLGFLPATGEILVHQVEDWVRLTTTGGYVLARLKN